MCHRLIRILIVLPLLIAVPVQAAVTGDALDQQVVHVFQKRCVACHDDLGKKAAGGVSQLTDLAWLADPDTGYIDGESAADSYLREVIGTADKPGKMPVRKFNDIAFNGPLSKDEFATVLKWIDRGGPSELFRQQLADAAKAAFRKDIPERAIVEHIARDLEQLNGAELVNARYLTLTNLHNMDSVSADDIELYRQGVVKLLNSLSRSSDVLGTDTSKAVHRMVAVDAERTIFRFDLRHIGWTAHDWEHVLQYYPYGLVHRDGVGRTVYGLTSSRIPYMRGDWFAFATSQPPLYHDLVGIPRTLPELEKRLGVDRVGQIQARKVHRAGLPADSNVSRHNRLLERLTFPGGDYHISYDFARSNGRANFFENPFGPVGTFNTQLAFKHDGGEVIYRLPNGFQAYVLVKSNGERLSIAPSAIVEDKTMPGGLIFNGISCLSCHYDGMKPESRQQAAKLDRVRLLTLDNVRRFKAADRDLIKELYPEPEVFGRLLEQDRGKFRRALAEAGITRTGVTEPVRALFDRFTANLDLEVAAAGFGVSVNDFTKRLDREGETRELRKRLEFAGVQRQLYVAEFHLIARLSGLGEPFPFNELGLPYFGVDPEASVAGSGQPVAAQQPYVDLLDADNLNGKIRLTVGSGDDRSHFRDGEVIPIVIRSNVDCFLTVLGIDPDGSVSLLAPNKWHPELKVRAGRSLHIPTPEMGFEFFAEPPHGTTQIRVIATTRPLQIQGAGRQALAQAQGGIISLGTAKSLRGKKGIGARQKPQTGRPAPVQPVNRPQEPTDIDLSRQFAPNDWATARWSFTTHP